MKLSKNIYNVGVYDKNQKKFENQYDLQRGMAFNSYLITGSKNVLLDSVDKEQGEKWLANIKEIIHDEKIDYLIVSHVEPDHSSNIFLLLKNYPAIKLIGTEKMFVLFEQFYPDTKLENTIIVKEGEELTLGDNIFRFITAPFVHWPEVMFTYVKDAKTLFTADAFGTFGGNEKSEWDGEARRYYYNIVGKYGAMTLRALKKIVDLDIEKLCPLHGVVIDNNIDHYVSLYEKWANYEAELDGVLIVYASMYGNTKSAALELGEYLRQKNVKTMKIDLNNTEASYVLQNAFKYSKLVLAAPTYDGGLLPCMHDFLYHLKLKGYKNRTVGLIENGSWGPASGKVMKSILGEMQGIDILAPMVTIKSHLNSSSRDILHQLGNKLS